MEISRILCDVVESGVTNRFPSGVCDWGRDISIAAHISEWFSWSGSVGSHGGECP